MRFNEQQPQHAACHGCWLYVGMSVKGDRVRVHLLGLIAIDELCRVSRNRGVWVCQACSVGVYTAWRICTLWQREVCVGLRAQRM